MSSAIFLTLPGDGIITNHNLNSSDSSSTPQLATGVEYQPIDQIYTTTQCGQLRQSNDIPSTSGSSGTTLWVETNTRRYNWHVNDYIIGTIVEKNVESYKVDVGNGQYGSLSTIAFDGATVHNCPKLHIGDLIYCRVGNVNSYLTPELTCCVLDNKRDWVTGEAMFGPLTGGMVVNLSSKFVHQLLQNDNPVLNILGKKIKFDITIGMNGVVWVNSESVRHTIIIINTLSKVDAVPNIDVATMVDRAIQVLAVSVEWLP